MTLLERYENRMVEARVAFSERVKELVQSTTRDNLAFFLIYHSALGVGMTKPVSRWIRVAGKRCRRKGYKQLGQALITHAKGEVGHHKWMIKDTKALVSWINKKRHLFLNPKDFLRCRSNAVNAYAKLHKATIKSDVPFGLLAMEFEMERVSVVHGFTLIKACVTRLGLSVLRHMSFVRKHIRLDLSHTNLNKKMMQTFLEAHPEALPEMVEKGKSALQTYGDYLQDCFIHASQDAQQYSLAKILKAA